MLQFATKFRYDIIYKLQILQMLLLQFATKFRYDIIANTNANYVDELQFATKFRYDIIFMAWPHTVSCYSLLLNLDMI